MLAIDVKKIKELRDILNKHHYGRQLYLLRRKQHFCSMWPEADWLEKNDSMLSEELKILYRLLLYGYKVDYRELFKVFDKTAINSMQGIGLLKLDNDHFYTKGLSIVAYMDKYFLAGISPNYCVLHEYEIDKPDVYIGLDTLLLANNLRYCRGSLLDLCSGTGIQGILAVQNSIEEVECVDLNPAACNIASFNAVLNNVSDRVIIREGNLFVASDKRYDMIVANPPYIPIPDGEDYFLSGDGGNDGLKVIRKILQGIRYHLQENGQLWMVGEIVRNSKGELLIDSELCSLEQEGYEVNMKLMCKNDLTLWANDVVDYWLDSRKDFSDKEKYKKHILEYYSKTFSAAYTFILQVTRNQ